ncbi:MAG: hypothetical protein HFF02_05270 [Erysipelotrichaceae bacterium]|nr:hypothetical protein [Erysipelotrichaceae bacterium]
MIKIFSSAFYFCLIDINKTIWIAQTVGISTLYFPWSFPLRSYDRFRQSYNCIYFTIDLQVRQPFCKNLAHDDA